MARVDQQFAGFGHQARRQGEGHGLGMGVEQQQEAVVAQRPRLRVDIAEAVARQEDRQRPCMATSGLSAFFLGAAAGRRGAALRPVAFDAFLLFFA